jgi:dTDP-glucose pyrophosphorylase
MTRQPGNFAQCQVRLNRSLAEGMRAIDKGGAGIALVLDDHGRLAGTLTDGDVRRGLLRGATLESPLEAFICRQFTSVGPEVDRTEILDIMQARSLRQVPIIDAAGNVIGLHLLHEILGAVDRPNWAVIMAGGMGTRLRPITEKIPKPMIKVAGRPILERLVLHLVGFGIKRVFLAINYMGEVIERHFGDGQRFGCRIEYLRESESLGSGGALALLPIQPTDPVVVLNGDLVTQANIARLLAFHEEGGWAATIGLKPYAHQVPFGCVELDGDRVRQFQEKPILERWVGAGLYVLSPALVARVPAKFFPITNLFSEALEREEPLGAFRIEEDWIDVGHFDQLKTAREGHG